MKCKTAFLIIEIAALLCGCGDKADNATSARASSEKSATSISGNFEDVCAAQGEITETGRQMGGALQCLPLSSSPAIPVKLTGPLASFARPTAVTTDGFNVYVVDNDRVRKISIMTGEVATLAELKKATDHQAMPAAHGFPGITTDGKNLYVADQEHNEVRKVVIATGEMTTLTGFDSYAALQGITFDGKYVYALGVISLFKIDPVTGKFDQRNLKSELGLNAMPISLTTDDRNLYVLSQAEVRLGGHVIGPEIKKIEIDTGHATTLTHLGNSIGWGSYLTTDGKSLYITSPDFRFIYQVEIASGVMTTVVESGNASESSVGFGEGEAISKPTGITSDGRNLYVSDSQDARIRKIAISNRRVTTLAGSTPGEPVDGISFSGLALPVEGMTSDGKNLYVTVPSNSSIRSIVLGTNTVSTLLHGNLSFPKGLIYDNGKLYIAGYNNHSIRQVEIDTGKETTLAGSGEKGSKDGIGESASFNYPYGLASDGTNIYVADYNNSYIRKVEITSGKVTTLAGSGTEGARDGIGQTASFSYPRGLAVDAGVLYVADYNNNLIRQVEVSSGKVTTLAGSEEPGLKDGVGRKAMFRQPSDIVVEGDKLYVADTFNNVIRQIEISTGKVTTLAGSGKEGHADGIGAAVSFDQPLALTIVGGKLYVADSEYRLIRSIDLATGAVETLMLKGMP